MNVTELKRELLVQAGEEEIVINAVNETAQQFNVPRAFVFSQLISMIEAGVIEVYRYGNRNEKQFVTLGIEQVESEYRRDNFDIFLFLPENQ